MVTGEMSGGGQMMQDPEKFKYSVGGQMYRIQST